MTDQQRNAIHAHGNVCLVSCPGSGKTRAIVAKLLHCIEEVRDSTRCVACITHTNAAADEIDVRLRRICMSGEDLYYEVTTIHSFALNNILRPFYRVLPEFPHGFEILASDDDRFLEERATVMQTFRIPTRNAENFEGIQRLPDGTVFSPEGIPYDAALQWCTWFDQNGYISLGDIVYHSCRVLAQREYVTSALASHFAWILVDEFQDSSPGQVHILKEIHRYGRTRFFCVGDPNQSIYGFAGASPELLCDFAAYVSADQSHCLSSNFRSSQLIVDVAEALCSTSPQMTAAGEYRDWPDRPSYHHASSRLDGILTTFLPSVRKLTVPYGEVAILAPWWTTLYHLGRELRAHGIPVVGPGARPYKRTHLLEQLAETAGAYLESSEPDIAREVQRALFHLLLDITGQPNRAVFAFSGRVVVCELLRAAAETERDFSRAQDWIRCAAGRFGKILVKADFLPNVLVHALIESADAMANDIDERHQSGTLTIQDLGIFARPKHCVHLLTIHKAKGREFEAVALIDAHDGRLPHFSLQYERDRSRWQAKYDEARRQVYVAATRAKRLLMFFTDGEDERNVPSPFLGEMGFL